MANPQDTPRQGARVRHVTVDGQRDGQRLDNFLLRELKGVPRSAVHRMIRTGQVRINGRRAKAATRLEEGDEVRIPPAETNAGSKARVPDRVVESLSNAIIHDDGAVLVIDKPAGIAVHGGGGLAWGVIEALRQARPEESLELAHRLDRETSGCLLVARGRHALVHLQDQLRDQGIDKRYLCLLDGRLGESRVTVDAPLRKVERSGERRVVVDPEGKPSSTTFRLLETWGGASYAEAELHTGRTHQIRAHAVHLGMPLAGDDRYAERDRLAFWKRHGLSRLFLHAHQVTFTDATGETVVVNSPLPEDLRAVLNSVA